jgi:hypothetical protein
VQIPVRRRTRRARPAPLKPRPTTATQAPVDRRDRRLGRGVRGRLDAPQPPILELNEADIAAYGAGSLAELMQALAPQTGSSGGRGGGSR